MNKKFVENIEVNERSVLVRNDFNVPLDDEGNITDDTRIRASIRTIDFLLKKGAKIILASHLGRPKGKKVSQLTLRPVAKRLSEILKREVKFMGECLGTEIDKLKSNLKSSEILLLENLRFYPGEIQNDEVFARELAKEVEVYVNDAFGVSHRSHSSVSKICEFVPVSVAGFLLKKEIDYLSLAVDKPVKNYLVILGGVKVSDKIPLIKNLINKARTIIIGGAMAYTFLKAKRIEVGKSKVEDDYLDMCSKILKEAKQKKVKLIFPVDHIAAMRVEPRITVRMINKGDPIPAEMMGLDIGLETIEKYVSEIKRAELIVWNGPMGVFEIDEFSAGTIEIAKAIAESKGTSIVGGGDSISAVHKAGVADKISHISTGGGASLEFLSGKELPGIVSLSEDI